MFFLLSNLLLGLLALIFGSSLLIKAIKTISLYFKLKPLFLSIVILGFISSAPEWFITVTANFKNLPDAALGNILGSNIINILLVLSLAGLFYKCPANKQIIHFDIPVLIVSFLILALMCLNQKLDFFEALLLLGIFFSYIFILLYKRKETNSESLNLKETNLSPIKAFTFLILGFLILFAGSSITVDSSLKLVKAFGLSERFAGIFILSLSTSLPELAIALQVSLKKEGDIAMGNIIGSNIFNTLFILSSSALIKPLSIAKEMYYDGIFMLSITLILWFFLLSVKKLPKPMCGIFIILYICYISFSSGLIQ